MKFSLTPIPSQKYLFVPLNTFFKALQTRVSDRELQVALIYLIKSLSSETYGVGLIDLENVIKLSTLDQTDNVKIMKVLSVIDH